MDGGTVAVIRLFVCVAWCEMETALDFFIEEGVFHRFGDEGIHPQREFPDVARPFIRVENFGDAVGEIGGCMNDTTVFERQLNIFISSSLINGRGVVSEGSVDRVPHWRGIHFAVRDVSQSGAFDNWNIFYGKGKVRARTDYFYTIGFFH